MDLSRKPEDVMRLRGKYGMGARCESCGGPTDALALKCEHCVTRQYVNEELGHAGDWLREHPGAQIEAGHDKKKRIHLVMFRLPQLAFCGEKVTQKRSERKAVKPGEFPAGVCERCIEIYEGLVQ